MSVFCLQAYCSNLTNTSFFLTTNHQLKIMDMLRHYYWHFSLCFSKMKFFLVKMFYNFYGFWAKWHWMRKLALCWIVWIYIEQAHSYIFVIISRLVAGFSMGWFSQLFLVFLVWASLQPPHCVPTLLSSIWPQFVFIYPKLSSLSPFHTLLDVFLKKNHSQCSA